MGNRELTKERIEYLLSIVNCALNREKASFAYEEDAVSLLRENSLLPICYKYFVNADELKAETQYYSAMELQKVLQLQIVLSKLREIGVEPVLFKGIVLANLYPSYFERISSDTDMYVSEEEYHKVDKLLINLGYVINPEASKYKAKDQKKIDGVNADATIFLGSDGCFLDEITPKVGNYYNEQTGHWIELHTCLWEDYTGKRMEALESFHLTDKATYVRQKACGLEVTTLGYTEHLIFQMFHIIKHFSLQGVGMRYLCDIVLFVNEYCNEIDWKRFWDSMQKMGYEEFSRVFFALGNSYLRMQAVPMCDVQNVTDEKKIALAYDLFMRGKVDENDQSAWEIYGALTPYFTGESAAAKSDISKKIRYIFPSISNLPNNYGYAKKYPILLPIAWIHRVVLYLLRKSDSNKDVASASDKMKATNYRLSMMEDMGLIKNDNES